LNHEIIDKAKTFLVEQGKYYYLNQTKYSSNIIKIKRLELAIANLTNYLQSLKIISKSNKKIKRQFENIFGILSNISRVNQTKYSTFINKQIQKLNNFTFDLNVCTQIVNMYCDKNKV